jgi:hypothetical protein
VVFKSGLHGSKERFERWYATAGAPRLTPAAVRDPVVIELALGWM